MSGKLVANFALDRPKLYVNIAHLRAEAADPEPVTKHGWQEAFQAIYPAQDQRVQIVNGEATYVDDGPFEPLELTAINFVADNIRNIRSRGARLSVGRASRRGRVQEGQGHRRRACRLPGRAPSRHQGQMWPSTASSSTTSRRHQQLQRGVNKGVLSAKGLVEYAPTIKVVDLEQATIRQRAGRVRPHAGQERRRPGGHRQDREGRAGQQ